MPTHCTHCGAALAPNSAFCSACGQPVAAPHLPDPAQTPPPVAPQYGVPPQAPYGQPPPQAPYGQVPYGQPPQTPYNQIPPQTPYSQATPLVQKLQSLPFLAALPVGLRLPALAAAAILALVLLNKMAHPGGASAPGQPGGSPTAQAGVFQGRCMTEQGTPLANVDVKIQGLTGAGMNTTVDAHTNANGVYSQTLPPGKYAVFNANYPVTLGTTSYLLPLTVPNGENNDGADIGPGIVRNLVLKIHGKVSPTLPEDEAGSYYGGTISMPLYGRYQMTQAPDNSIVEMTFTPEGPLADGTTGQTIVLQQVNHQNSSGTWIHFYDIPLGTYTLTARLLNPDGSLLEPLNIGPGDAAMNASAYKPSLSGVTFPANGHMDQVGMGQEAGALLQLSLYDGG